jgi:hypothetical protein
MAVAVVSAAVFLGVSGLVLARLVSEPDSTDAGRSNAGAQQAPDLVVPADPSPPVSIAPAPVPAPESSAPAAAAPAAPAFAAGTFVLAGNAGEINLTLGRPAGGRAITVSTRDDSGIAPATAVSGTTVEVTTKRTGDKGDGRLDVQLDERIVWTIRMTGGVRKGSFALDRGVVKGVDLTGGADTIRLVLAKPDGKLPIRMSGGVRSWNIVTDGEAPVKVSVRRGAGAVTLYGQKDRGVARNTTLAKGRGPGLEVDAVAGMGELTVRAA